MDERLKKRIYAFYFAGAINLILGVYMLMEGRNFLAPGTALLVTLFFFGFAAVDFYFPYLLKKRWAEQVEQMRRQGMTGQQPKQ